MEWALFIVLLINDNQKVSIGNVFLKEYHTSQSKCIAEGKEKVVEMNESIPIENVKTHLYGYECKVVNHD